MRLAEELGARTETLAGHDMVRAVTGYVRRHNLTKVLVGRARTDWQHEGGWLEQGRMLLGRRVAGAGRRQPADRPPDLRRCAGGRLP